MSRSTRNRILIVAVFLGLAAVSVPQAQAGWGWGCWGSCYSPCWSSSWCYAPCYPVSYASCCYSGCYTSCWPCDSCYTTSCYGYCWDVACCDSVEVRKPADEPSLPSRPSGQPTLAPPEPTAAPELETNLFPPQPEPAEPAMPTPEAFPLEAKRGVLRPVPKPPAPAVDQPPTSLPDVRGMPVEPEGPAAPAMPTPAPPMPTPAPAEPAPAKPQAGLVPAPEQTRGVVAVWVPAQARVVINGLETTSIGPYREYVSHGLKPGAVYKYEIRAQIARDGRLIEKTRTVYLTAGARQRVAFQFEAKPEEAIAARW